METCDLVSLWFLAATALVVCHRGASSLRFDFQEEVFEIAVDKATGLVYVGGDNVVFMLDRDLDQPRNVTLKNCTRATQDCRNRVHVLEIDRTFGQLLVCGVEDEGSNPSKGKSGKKTGRDEQGVSSSSSSSRCWFLGLKDLAKQELEFENGSRIHVGNAQRTHVHEIYTAGARCSRWLVASPNQRNNSPILFTMNICPQNASFLINIARSSTITKSNPSFKYDFLDGFCHDSECFYLTHQHKSVTNFEVVSRMASVCESSLFPYVEIPFNHARDRYSPASGIDYPRALAVTLGNVGFEDRTELVVVAVFDNATGFAIGYIRLAKLKEKIQQTRSICVCGPTNTNIRAPDWYAETSPTCAGNASRQDNKCPDSTNTYRVIQNVKGDPIDYFQTVDVKEDDAGKVTSVFTHTQPLAKGPQDNTSDVKLDYGMVIYVTTSKGQLYTFYSQLGLVDELEVTPLPRTPHRGDEELPQPLRPDVAITDQHFYILAAKQVVRRDVDYCQEMLTCRECRRRRQGCSWCQASDTCQLRAKCQDVTDCPPEITKVNPSSAPVSGGTVLTIEGTDLQTTYAKVDICGQDCPRIAETQTIIMCQIPESPDGREQTCNITVVMVSPGVRFNYSDSATKSGFMYTVPTLTSFSPAKLLLSESANIQIKGENLNTGSEARLVLAGIKQNHTFLCDVVQGQRDALVCHVTNMTLPMNAENSTKEGELHNLCYNIFVIIDNYTVASTDNITQFCRCSNPTIQLVDIDNSTTFVSGFAATTVRGTNLDLVDVHLALTMHSEELQGPKCEACSNARIGTCVVCCSPDVTNPMSPGSADASFGMVSSYSGDAVKFVFQPISVRLLRDPEFSFVNHNDTASCLAVNAESKFTIKGTFLPEKLLYVIRAGMLGRCARGTFTSAAMNLTCDLSLSSSRGRRSRVTPAKDLEDDSVACGRDREDEDQERLDEDRGISVVRVRIRGRRYRVGCVQLRTGPTTTPDTPEKSPLSVGVIAGGAGGGLAVVVLLGAFCCCWRYRKRKFKQRRQYHRQLSATSAATLTRTESGGSGENSYVSVERLMNPTGDRKKQREIQESGLLIPRRRLTLGSVIGHGNFGCVFEGHYQQCETDEGSWKVVAVKTLLDPAMHAIDIKGFIDEAMLMKNFDHDHVLSLLGLSEGDRGPLVVLPYMERGDLLTYVKDENTVLSLGEVLRFAQDIASGMDYLASNKFVHRDLAARNCMLDEELRVRVADFGLCRDVYEKGYYRSDNKKKLPIRWMAMESIEVGTYTSKSDVWSLGVVVWEMTTRGTTPYPGVEGWDILRYLVAGRRLDQPFLCPDALYALMERCWRALPGERPTFREVEQDLVNLTTGLQEPAVPNAVSVLTTITAPLCHRFKDDEAVVLKVKTAMRNMSQGVPGYTLAGAGPHPSSASHDASTTSLFTSSPDYSKAQAAAPSSLPLPSTTTTATTAPPAPPEEEQAVGVTLTSAQGRTQHQPCVSPTTTSDDRDQAIPMTSLPGTGSNNTATGGGGGGGQDVASRDCEGGSSDTDGGGGGIRNSLGDHLQHGKDDGYFLLEQEDPRSVVSGVAAGPAAVAMTAVSLSQQAAPPGQHAAAEGASTSTASPLPLALRQQRSGVPSVSFYKRTRQQDTASKDDGYQYFELEQEESKL